MKKIVILALLFSMALSLAACKPAGRMEAGADLDDTTPSTNSSTVPGPTQSVSTAPPVTVPKNTEGPPITHPEQTQQEALILAMKGAFLREHSKDPITIEKLGISYFGAYGENHVAYFHCSCNYTQALREEVYGNLVFRYNNGQQLYVYRNGAVVTLKIAVDKGWFTQEELEQLHAYLYK